MVYAVSSGLLTVVNYVAEWVLCPETVLLVVISLSLFNAFRLFRGIFLCFCHWKYKRDEKQLAAEYKNLSVDEKDGLKKYCHEAKCCDMASFSLQGRRKTMEDRFSCIPHDLEENRSVYAVFDGHGGEFAAEYVEEQLFHSIRKEFTRGSFQFDTDSVKQVLTSLIRTIDAQLICIARDRMDLSGSTCVLAFQTKDMLTVANIGDSRAVMCTGDGRAVPMSIDHKPSDPKEQKRITEAGGFVTFNGVWRVAGVLATSRAFGDYPLKQRKFVTVEPDFFTVDLSKMDPHFVILASDGLWDVFTNEEAVDFVRARLDEPHFGAKSLALQAYYRGSLDNITVMVINLRRKRVLQKKHDRHRERQMDEVKADKDRNDEHHQDANKERSISSSSSSSGRIQRQTKDKDQTTPTQSALGRRVSDNKQQTDQDSDDSPQRDDKDGSDGGDDDGGCGIVGGEDCIGENPCVLSQSLPFKETVSNACPSESESSSKKSNSDDNNDTLFQS